MAVWHVDFYLSDESAMSWEQGAGDAQDAEDKAHQYFSENNGPLAGLTRSDVPAPGPPPAGEYCVDVSERE